MKELMVSVTALKILRKQMTHSIGGKRIKKKIRFQKLIRRKVVALNEFYHMFYCLTFVYTAQLFRKLQMLFLLYL